MDKSDFRCVETLPFYAGECFAVYVIAQQRMTQIRQMNPNLMGTPGFQPQTDERAAFGGLLDAVMRPYSVITE